jgi:hypothetical protein
MVDSPCGICISVHSGLIVLHIFAKSRMGISLDLIISAMTKRCQQVRSKAGEGKMVPGIGKRASGPSPGATSCVFSSRTFSASLNEGDSIMKS